MFPRADTPPHPDALPPARPRARAPTWPLRPLADPRRTRRHVSCLHGSCRHEYLRMLSRGPTSPYLALRP
eukprot:7230374-Prymnesium_polylepis.1